MSWRKELENRINKSFTETWYAHMRNQFVGNQYYDSLSNKIVDPSSYGVIEDVVIKDVDIDFRDFCFWGYGALKIKKDERFIDLYSFSKKLDYYIYGHVVETNDVIASYRFIYSILEYVGELFEQLKQGSIGNKGYHEILDDVYTYIQDRVITGNSKTSELYEVTNTYVDKLNFEMKQVELVSLLHLLQAADFIKLKDKKASSQFYTFCHRHFYCKKRDGPGYSPVTSELSKKLSAVNNNEHGSVLRTVFMRLREAYEKQL